MIALGPQDLSYSQSYIKQQQKNKQTNNKQTTTTTKLSEYTYI